MKKDSFPSSSVSNLSGLFLCCRNIRSTPSTKSSTWCWGGASCSTACRGKCSTESSRAAGARALIHIVVVNSCWSAPFCDSVSADGIISDPSRGENCLLIATDGSGLGADYYCIRIYTKMIKKNKLFRVSLLHKDVSLVSWCVKNKVFEILFGLTVFHVRHKDELRRRCIHSVAFFFNKVHTNYNKWRESLFQLWSNIWSRFHVLRQAISKVLLVRIDYGCWWGGKSLQGVHPHANGGQGDAQSHGELHDGRGRERGGFALRLVRRLRCDSQHFLQVIKNLQEEAERGVAYTACIRNIHFLFLSVSTWIFFFPFQKLLMALLVTWHHIKGALHCFRYILINQKG